MFSFAGGKQVSESRWSLVVGRRKHLPVQVMCRRRASIIQIQCLPPNSSLHVSRGRFRLLFPRSVKLLSPRTRTRRVPSFSATFLFNRVGHLYQVDRRSSIIRVIGLLLFNYVFRSEGIKTMRAVSLYSPVFSQ